MTSKLSPGTETPTPEEGQHFDRKSLRTVTGSASNFSEIAQDCVCFANAAGGTLFIGIEDGERAPPPGQKIDPSVIDRLRKRIGELTVNVEAHPEIVRDNGGAEYIALRVARSVGVASTSDGRYFVRVGDTCRPVVGDDVLRLATERPSVPWERLTSLDVHRTAVDRAKLTAFAAAVRASGRVKASVKEKSEDELLDHYGLAAEQRLTNLGVLLLGTASDRARLGTAPVVQAIRYDERGTKIDKHSWDDHALSPLELVEAIWETVPDFREGYELPDGMFRKTVPAFERLVVRELLVNALVHRPYTQRGDIFMNLHPDRLEVVNPGRLPLGVTPRNILHASRRRNDDLARVFHDLELMEREGSGFDLMYELLLTSGRAAPTATEGTDSVHVVVPRRVVHPGVVRLLVEADQRFHLTQRERIALGMLAQTEGLSAAELATCLELTDAAATHGWIDRLVEVGLVEQAGRGKATHYHVPPRLLRQAGLDGKTTLVRVQPHRLRALILEDLERYPASALTDVRRRVGPEIPERTFRRAMDALVADGDVTKTGEHRWRRYSAAPSLGQGGTRGR